MAQMAEERSFRVLAARRTRVKTARAAGPLRAFTAPCSTGRLRSCRWRRLARTGRRPGPGRPSRAWRARVKTRGRAAAARDGVARAVRIRDRPPVAGGRRLGEPVAWDAAPAHRPVGLGRREVRAGARCCSWLQAIGTSATRSPRTSWPRAEGSTRCARPPAARFVLLRDVVASLSRDRGVRPAGRRRTQRGSDPDPRRFANRANYAIAFPGTSSSRSPTQDQPVVRQAFAPADYAGGNG